MIVFLIYVSRYFYKLTFAKKKYNALLNHNHEFEQGDNCEDDSIEPLYPRIFSGLGMVLRKKLN